MINFHRLKDQLQEYIDARVELSKFQIKEQLASSLSNFLVALLMLGLCFFLLLFVSFAVGYYLNELFESVYMGFAIVAAFYLVVSILVIAYRKRIVALVIYKLYVAPEVEEKLKYEE